MSDTFDTVMTLDVNIGSGQFDDICCYFCIAALYYSPNRICMGHRQNNVC